MIRKSLATVLTLISFSLVYVLPPEAVWAASHSKAGPASPPDSPAAGLARTLERTERFLERQLSAPSPAAGNQAAPAVEVDVKALKSIRKDLESQGEEVLKQIAADGERIRELGLPEAVAERHRATTLAVRDGLASFAAALGAAESAAPAERVRLVDSALAVLREAQGPAFHNPLDPAKLPYRPRGPEAAAEPRLDASQFAAAGEALAAKAAPPAPEDLAETVDAPFSEGIVELADSLGGDPLAIYNWVRENVRFVPTFGSIQGAEACRLSLECNAFDTASLLIALLRVSEVPARYLIGTVELDPDLFRSAVGDFVDVRAAARLAASGGVPTVLVNDGAGETVAVRMEHVWVEAWVNYLPGRGAAAGAGDGWVPLDAAVKRTLFKPAMDVAAAAAVDLQGLIDDLAATGTVGNGGSSVTGLSQALATGQIDVFQTAVVDQIENQLQDATVGDLLGAIDIQAPPLELLPASLPGTPLVVGERTPSLTPASRHRVTVRLLDRFGIGEVLRFDSSTVELAGQRLTLGYRASTAADVATIESFGGLFETPPYLVDLTPVVSLEGVVVATGSPVPMGTTQKLRVSFQEPDGSTDSVEHVVAAGTYAAIGLDLQRVSDTAVEARTAKLEAARAELGVTDVLYDDVMGEVLNLHSLNYFLEVEAANHTAANQLDVVALKRPAEMLATYAPVFAFSFGVAVDVVNTGMNVDVRRYVVSVSSRTGDRDVEREYVVSTGAFSSLAENGIFEQLHQAPAVSAVQLIAEANNRGIPIFTIDQTNASVLVPQLDVSSAVVSDILNSVAAGKQVITPQQEFSFFQWSGLGYIVLDLATGAGAYLISGGLAGGGTADLSDLLSNINNLASLFGFLAGIAALIFAGLAISVPLLTALGVLIAAAGVIAGTWYVYNETGSILATVVAGLYAVMAAVYLYAVGAALAGAILTGGATVAAAIAFLYVVTVIVAAILFAVTFLLTLFAIVSLYRRFIDGGQRLAAAPEPSFEPGFGLPVPAAI